MSPKAKSILKDSIQKALFHLECLSQPWYISIPSREGFVIIACLTWYDNILGPEFLLRNGF